MKIRKLCKVGNSLMVSLPREMLAALKMQAGDYLDISLMDEEIKIERNFYNPHLTASANWKIHERRK